MPLVVQEGALLRDKQRCSLNLTLCLSSYGCVLAGHIRPPPFLRPCNISTMRESAVTFRLDTARSPGRAWMRATLIFLALWLGLAEDSNVGRALFVAVGAMTVGGLLSRRLEPGRLRALCVSSTP